MKRPVPVAAVALASCVCVLFAGCEQPAPPPVTAPKVTVALPVQRNVSDYTEFTGRIAAFREVEIRARVQGYLEAVKFTDGDEVEKDQLLFVIEQPPYVAQVNAAKAKVKDGEAKLKLSMANLSRAQQLYEKEAITLEEWQTRIAERDVAQADVLQSQADLEQANINLGYTEIRSPLAGVADRSLVDPGNLVGGLQSTLLTTVVQMDPVYAYFDISETAVLNYLRWRNERASPEEKAPATLALKDETDFTHEGVIDFAENRVDPSTGTLVVRGVFQNPKGVLYPGLSIRVRLRRQELEGALLVSEQALGTDLSGKYLLVVGADNVVEQRRVELGPQDGEMRVITKGLAVGDRYILKGLQRARAGNPVEPVMAEVASTPRDPGGS